MNKIERTVNEINREIEDEKDLNKSNKILCGTCLVIGSTVFAYAIFEQNTISSIIQYAASAAWLSGAGIAFNKVLKRHQRINDMQEEKAKLEKEAKTKKLTRDHL